MRKIWAFMLLAILAAGIMGCTPPVVENPIVPDSPVIPDNPIDKLYVYDSTWTLRDTGVALSTSRNLSVPITLQTYVDNYNAIHIDDQLFITEGEISVAEAPTCEIWIVDSITNVIEFMPGGTVPYHLTGVPREDVVGRREAWRIECQGIGGATLYVDKAPPPEVAPPPPDTRPDYVKYAIYMIDADADGDVNVESIADIVLEDHCEDISDAPSKESYYATRVEAFILDTKANPSNGWTVVYERLYPAE